MIDIKGFDVELTNKCVLKCPRCARTDFINKFGISAWKNQDLNFENFKKFFDIPLNGIHFNFCGTLGDPIYYPTLFPLIAWLKQNNATVEIATNGSYKKDEWWMELTSYLTEKDTLVFGIDGTPENFTEYRINGDWNSIKTGLKISSKSAVKVVWKYIPFKFNENTIDQARTIAMQLGVDEFLVCPSSRWINNDNLKPINKINTSLITKSVSNNEINPECYNKRMHYISASGHYTPCCYIADWRFYYKTEFYKNKDFYDISKTSITKILSNEQTINFYNTIHKAKMPVCTYNCPKL